ncbi:hypothetical protein ACFQ0M_04390 [Kitasatospora aburaviensis]
MAAHVDQRPRRRARPRLAGRQHQVPHGPGEQHRTDGHQQSTECHRPGRPQCEEAAAHPGHHQRDRHSRPVAAQERE